jgi:hypothetical protein
MCKSMVPLQGNVHDSCFDSQSREGVPAEYVDGGMWFDRQVSLTVLYLWLSSVPDLCLAHSTGAAGAALFPFITGALSSRVSPNSCLV